MRSDRQKVISYIEQGLAREEIIDLWNVAFPESYDVRYDDGNATICYSSAPEAIQTHRLIVVDWQPRGSPSGS